METPNLDVALGLDWVESSARQSFGRYPYRDSFGDFIMKDSTFWSLTIKVKSREALFDGIWRLALNEAEMLKKRCLELEERLADESYRRRDMERSRP